MSGEGPSAGAGSVGEDTTPHPEPTADTLLADARAWRDQDPDDVTRAELVALIERVATGDPAATDDLRDRFGSRLQFGTAGLRGALGAGPNRMNRVLVAQAAAGLARWLLERGSQPSVVVGYDGRTNSAVFARDTVELLQGAGVRAVLLPRLLPTPVLAFAVRHLGMSAGVMVTASHNPAADNGYKVYLGGSDGGSQIVSPTDEEIARSIRLVAETTPVGDLPRSSGYETADDAVLDEYVRRTAVLAASTRPDEPLRVVYTAMHGVGWETAKRVFEAAGFPAPLSVAQQQEPDAAFPTVAFPNPEEPGALDLALRTAREAGADLVIANDPDADRLAVAIPAADGDWRVLSGNEVGSLLGWRAAERVTGVQRRSDGPHPPSPGPASAYPAAAHSEPYPGSPRPALAASLVSSPALAAIAAAHGLDFVETLTGFKYISRAPGLVFGYEEALGYLVDPAKVRDKDGVSAAVDFLSLVTELRASGLSVADRLEELAARFGGFASGQVSIRVAVLSDIPRVMRQLREHPPTTLGSTAVTTFEDFLDGVGDFPASDILRLTCDDGTRVIVRPSGTEPKLKIYLDALSTRGTGAERIADARARVDALQPVLRALVNDALR